MSALEQLRDKANKREAELRKQINRKKERKKKYRR
jgi:hypothetical protein